ncbi:MAG: hypothetical protein WCD76_06775 [Pyrinomonadaceae bacterium]
MRHLYSKLFAFILLLAMTPTLQAGDLQETDKSSSTPKQVTLLLELQDLPGRDTAGSAWEVTYQWRIADQQNFNQWSVNGENPSEQATLGMLLSRQSFARRNLSNSANRRFQILIPVKGDLLERLNNAGQRPQIVWLDATVRIHDAKLGIDVVKKVTPVWGPRFYRDGISSVRMDITPEGKLRWFTTDVPPWAAGQRQGVKKSRIPSP